tara:strand:- start:15 stop:941 length:927 start_codon:yes stop_codon:yes gene_type:complete
MPSDSTFVEVKNAFQAIAGLESLTAADEFFLTSSVNRAVSRAYNSSDSWPRYLVIGEERNLISLTLSGATASTSPLVNQNYKLLGSNTTGGTNVYQGVTTSTVIIYNTGTAWRVDTVASATVQASGTYTVGAGTQQFIEADTNKKDNVAGVETWTPRAGADVLSVNPNNLIPYAQTNKGTIGEFLRVYRSKPFLNNSSIEYEFYVDSLGCNALNLKSLTSNSVFVNYKKELTTNYTPDSIDIPSEFVDYIIYTALADFYTGDGQAEKAALAANQANAMLDMELLRLDKKANNNTINKKFSTYVNRQAR